MYGHVPLGFEMVLENREVKAWNLWWNVTLTDDPSVWDEEIKLINEMQDRLSGLTPDQRLIRAHMAEFCRYHPLFPASIDLLCEEIGGGAVSKPVKMGCEGRGLLDSLGRHNPQSLRDQRDDILAECRRSLEKWLARGEPENPRESKTFAFLGERMSGKEGFAKKLISAIDCEEPSIFSLRGLDDDECRKTWGKSEPLRVRPFNCFECPETSLGEGAVPGCQCCYSMIIDSGLLSAGVLRENGSDHDGFSSFTEEHILAYAAAVNSWLTEAPPTPAASLATGCYIHDTRALEIAQRVRSSLGERGEVKEWLAACLLKTIKSNQRWHEGTELIDDHPEATSWLREKTGRA